MKRIVILATLVLTTLTGFSQHSYIRFELEQPAHEIEVYNTNGQLVYYSTSLNYQVEHIDRIGEPTKYFYIYTIDLSNLPTGCYILRIDRRFTRKYLIAK